MKKTLNLILAGTLITSVIACSDNNGGSGDTKNQQSTNTTLKRETNDQVLPSRVDDSEVSTADAVVLASIGSAATGSVIALWKAAQLYALQKTLSGKDNEKVSKAIEEYALAKENFQKISNELPLSMDEVLAGNVDGAQRASIKTKLENLVKERDKAQTKLKQATAKLGEVSGEEAKLVEQATKGKSQAAAIKESTERGKKVAQLKETSAKLTEKITEQTNVISEIDSQIESSLKFNKSLFKTYKRWALARARLKQAYAGFDKNFAVALKSSLDRIFARSSYSFDEEGVRDTRLARLKSGKPQLRWLTTSGALALVAGGLIVWTTISDVDQDTHNLKLKIASITEHNQNDENYPRN
jgi:hypothetical protein